MSLERMKGVSLEMEMRIFCGALILSFFCSLVSPDGQGEALTALKESLKASGSQLSDWYTTSVNPCTWSKIKCDASNNVISVSLADMGFSGTLSPKIGALKKLTILSLQGNRITGRILEELGNLSSLTMVDLTNNQLSGEIPPSLGNLKMLQSLYLNQNNLTGTIPQSLSTLPSLTNLHLDSNSLTGQIPKSLFGVSQYNFTGNHLNCGFNFSRRCESRNVTPSKSKTGVVAIVVGLIVLVGGLLLFCMRGRLKGYKQDNFEDVAGEVDRQIEFNQLRRFLWTELQIATNNFSEKNVLGQGGFGKVYKGVLADNTKIAVKRLTNYKSPSGDVAFYREVEMISVAVHRNLLRLIGFCTTITERLLVYPFMPNLSLASRLRELQPGEAVLDWPTTNRVALGTARGLEYCNPKIIHRDVKAANVLLDEYFEAVVGDFGLAKVVDVGKTNVTTRVCGTMGHIAPEYLHTGKSSEKTDVFGYGVMLLELVTGQRVADFSRHEEEDDVLFLDHVKNLKRENRLHAIVDGNLNNKYDKEELETIIQIALPCTQASPEERPAMSVVVRMLEGEGLAERWREWQHIEVNRKQEYDWLDKRIEWSENSTFRHSAIELSAAR